MTRDVKCKQSVRKYCKNRHNVTCTLYCKIIILTLTDNRSTVSIKLWSRSSVLVDYIDLEMLPIRLSERPRLNMQTRIFALHLIFTIGRFCQHFRKYTFGSQPPITLYLHHIVTQNQPIQRFFDKTNTLLSSTAIHLTCVNTCKYVQIYTEWLQCTNSFIRKIQDAKQTVQLALPCCKMGYSSGNWVHSGKHGDASAEVSLFQEQWFPHPNQAETETGVNEYGRPWGRETKFRIKTSKFRIATTFFVCLSRRQRSMMALPLLNNKFKNAYVMLITILLFWLPFCNLRWTNIDPTSPTSTTEWKDHKRFFHQLIFLSVS